MPTHRARPRRATQASPPRVRPTPAPTGCARFIFEGSLPIQRRQAKSSRYNLLHIHLLELRQPHRRRYHHRLRSLDLIHLHLYLSLADLALFVEKNGYDDCQSREAADPPGPVEGDDCGGDDGVHDGQGQQQLPAEAHQAVVANARQRDANPDEEKEEDGHFDKVDQDRKTRDAFETKEAPAAKEERGSDGTDRYHVDVLGHLVEAPAQAAVFGQVASRQFLLGFREIERGAVDLGDTGDQVETEAQWLRQDEPDAQVTLRIDNTNHTERPGKHQRAAQGQSQARLIRDHLGRAAQRTQQRVAVARRPATQHDAIDRQRRDGEYPQNADIDVANHRVPHARFAIHPAIANGNNSEGAQRNHHRNDGRNQVDSFFRLRWHDLLFEDHLDGIGDGLEHTGRTSAVGSQTTLQFRHHAPLDQGHIGEGRQQRENGNGALDNACHNGIVEKFKHVPPPAPAFALPALPGRPRSVRYRTDCWRRFPAAHPGGWHSSIFALAGLPAWSKSPNRPSRLAGAAGRVRFSVRGDRHWSRCRPFPRRSRLAERCRPVEPFR